MLTLSDERAREAIQELRQLFGTVIMEAPEYVPSVEDGLAVLKKWAESAPQEAGAQHTICAVCLIDKPTPLRIDWMGGYVCLTCINEELEQPPEPGIDAGKLAEGIYEGMLKAEYIANEPADAAKVKAMNRVARAIVIERLVQIIGRLHPVEIKPKFTKIYSGSAILTSKENLEKFGTEAAEPRRVNFNDLEPNSPQEELVYEICRELYDRFMMGGWEPHDAHDWLRQTLQAAEPRPDDTRRDIYGQRLSLIRNCYGDFFDAEFVARAEPRRDEREAAMDAIERVIEMADSYKTASQMTLADARNALKYFRGSAAPLKQTPTSLIAGARLRHTEKISELNNLNENLLRALREIEKLSRAYACNQVGLDILKIAESALASLPQPSAGQWISAKDRRPDTARNIGIVINGDFSDPTVGYFLIGTETWYWMAAGVVKTTLKDGSISHWCELSLPSAGQTEGK